VKSFALEKEQGNPKSRQWIETRLLTKQNGKWVGYSYEWNAEQTEAKLVEPRCSYCERKSKTVIRHSALSS